MFIQSCSSLVNLFRFRNAWKGFWIILALLLVSLQPLPGLASVTKELHFEWDYDVNTPDLRGYIIYVNGVELVNINTPGILELEYPVELETGTTAVFTMKAYDANNNKSALSEPYSLVIPPDPVGNTLPVANINLSSWSGTAPFTVECYGEGSRDNDGTIVTYAWQFGDGGSAATSTARHTYPVAGTYTITLTVTDNDGGSASTSTTVTVAPAVANQAPTALFYPTATSGTTPLDVTFDGAHSTDNDGSIVSYAWNFGDGGSTTGAQVSHVFTAVGTFTVRLTVTDNSGSQAAYETVITVSSAPVKSGPPVAVMTYTPQSPLAGETVQFSGAASTAQEGNLVHYLWDFGDGSSASGVTAAHIYTVAGQYTAQLTVWDGNDATGQASAVITVTTKSRSDLTRRAQATQNAINLLLLKKSKKK